MRYIDIDDAESVLRAIRETPEEREIEIILHTPGGLILAAQQIAAALARHQGKVTAVVPHYAMSGGTVIAMAAARRSRRSRASAPGSSSATSRGQGTQDGPPDVHRRLDP